MDESKWYDNILTNYQFHRQYRLGHTGGIEIVPLDEKGRFRFTQL